MASEEKADVKHPESGTLQLGEKGAGINCLDKTFAFSINGAVAGAAYGSVAACFLNPIKGVKTPMIGRALGVIGTNSVLLAAAGASFGSVTCLSARYRDKDDFWNAALGGASVGAVFGLKARSLHLGLGLAAGLAIVCGVVKYRFSTYLPELPSNTGIRKFPPTPSPTSDNSH